MQQPITGIFVLLFAVNLTDILFNLGLGLMLLYICTGCTFTSAHVSMLKFIDVSLT